VLQGLHLVALGKTEGHLGAKKKGRPLGASFKKIKRVGTDRGFPRGKKGLWGTFISI